MGKIYPPIASPQSAFKYHSALLDYMDSLTLAPIDTKHSPHKKTACSHLPNKTDLRMGKIETAHY